METQKLEIAAEIVIERCKAEIGKEEVRSGDRNCKLNIAKQKLARKKLEVETEGGGCNVKLRNCKRRN